MSETLSPMEKLEALRRWIGDGSLEAGRRREEVGDALQAAVGAARQHKPTFDRLDELTALLDLVEPDPDALRLTAGRLYKAGKHLETTDKPDAVRLWTQHLCPDAAKEVDRLDATLRKAWGEHLAAMFERHAGLGEVLDRFERTRDLGSRMVESARAGIALGRSWPPNAQTRRTLAQRGRELEGQNAELARAGASDGVARLLLAVTGGEATLADLTQQVWDWLREQDALELFQLTLRRSR